MTNKQTTIFLSFLITAYVIVFSFLSFALVDTFKANLNDIGNMDQAVWNTLHGYFLGQSNTLDGSDLVRFYEHFDPVLLFFVPFYAIVASVKWLLFFQSLAIGLSVIPVFLLARKKLSGFAAILLSTCYLLYPALQNANLNNFHPVVLAVPVIAFMLWAIEEQRFRLFWGLSPLLLIMKEEMSLVLLFFGLYLLCRKHYRHGALAIVTGIVAFVLIMGFVIPHFSPVGGHPLLSADPTKYEAGYASRYGWLGNSASDILHTMVTRPFYVLEGLVWPRKLHYLFSLLGPLLFLPLFSSVFLLAIPTLAVNMLSGMRIMFHTYFYYSAVLAPVFFIGTIFVLHRFSRRSARLANYTLAFVCASCIFFHVTQGVLPYCTSSLRYSVSDFRQTQEQRQVHSIAAMIEPSASVSVQSNLGVFFSQRHHVYRFPLKSDAADYVVLHFANPFAGDYAPEKLNFIVNTSFNDMGKTVCELLSQRGYVVYIVDGNYLVLKGNFFH